VIFSNCLLIWQFHTDNWTKTILKGTTHFDVFLVFSPIHSILAQIRKLLPHRKLLSTNWLLLSDFQSAQFESATDDFHHRGAGELFKESLGSNILMSVIFFFKSTTKKNGATKMKYVFQALHVN
jgi:hypothetical protein